MRQTFLAIIAASAGMLLQAHAADFEVEPAPPVAEAPPEPYGPPPVAEAPPERYGAPPAVVVAPELRCPLVWRCGPWNCGWRPVCGPLARGFYGPPGPRYWHGYGRYAGVGRPYWGERWGDWGHWR